jgi:hypothetical protein
VMALSRIFAAPVTVTSGTPMETGSALIAT